MLWKRARNTGVCQELTHGCLTVGDAAEGMSAVASPPVAEVEAPKIATKGSGEAFAEAMSLELVQKESSLAGKPLRGTSALNDVGSPRGFEDALGLEELPHRKQPTASAGSTPSEAGPAVSAEPASFLSGSSQRSMHCSTGVIPEGVEGSSNPGADPSPATHLEASEAVPSGAMATPGAGSNLPNLPEPAERAMPDRTGLPIGSAAAASEAARASAPSHSNPVAPVLAERTRSEAAFMEAMPLELPKKKQPPAAKPAVSARTASDISQPDEALPLEKMRPHSRPSASRRQHSLSSASSSSSQQGASWEQAVPLEMTRRRGPSAQASMLPDPHAYDLYVPMHLWHGVTFPESGLWSHDSLERGQVRPSSAEEGDMSAGSATAREERGAGQLCLGGGSAAGAQLEEEEPAVHPRQLAPRGGRQPSGLILRQEVVGVPGATHARRRHHRRSAAGGLLPEQQPQLHGGSPAAADGQPERAVLPGVLGH